MKRILFQSIIAVLALTAMLMPVEAQAAGKKQIGLQLYSVGNLIGDSAKFAQNAPKVLAEIAKMGYTDVQPSYASYRDGKIYGMQPEAFKAVVEQAGLKCTSTHAGRSLNKKEIESGDFSEALKWWDKCIATHKAAGIEYVVIPSMPVPTTLSELEVCCRFYNEVGQRCREAGIKFGYHNHSSEFVKIEGTLMYDYMLEHIDSENMFFEMDVYWAVIGKASPVDYFNKYPGRFTILHIKDRREIGQSGMVGFDAIFNNAKTAGMKLSMVEMEASTSGDMLQGVRESIEYLKKAPFVKKTYLK